jgi:hypothetical protein
MFELIVLGSNVVQKAIGSMSLCSIETLSALRRFSLRKRIWYSSLTGVERSIVNLTIKIVDEIRSPLLAKTIKQVLLKLSNALKSGYMYRFEAAGRPIAERLGEVAFSWGNKAALSWKNDISYIRWLGMSQLNIWYRS